MLQTAAQVDGCPCRSLAATRDGDDSHGRFLMAQARRTWHEASAAHAVAAARIEEAVNSGRAGDAWCLDLHGLHASEVLACAACEGVAAHLWRLTAHLACSSGCTSWLVDLHNKVMRSRAHAICTSTSACTFRFWCPLQCALMNNSAENCAEACAGPSSTSTLASHVRSRHNDMQTHAGSASSGAPS